MIPLLSVYMIKLIAAQYETVKALRSFVLKEECGTPKASFQCCIETVFR